MASINDITRFLSTSKLEKLRSNFIWVYTIVLLVYHWELIYTFFQFSTSENRQTRIEIISAILNKQSWFLQILYPALIAFSSILLFLSFNTLSAALSDFYKKVILSYLLNVIRRGQRMVPAEEHDRVLTNFTKSLQKISELEVASAKIITEREDFNLYREKSSNEITSLNTEATNNKNEASQLRLLNNQMLAENNNLLRLKNNYLVFSEFNTAPGLSDRNAPRMIESNFLFFPSATITFWLLMDHKKLINKVINNQYIIGHDTNDGDVIPGTNYYSNAFGLSLSPDEYHKPCQKINFRLWISNGLGSEKEIQLDITDDDEGWTHFCVQWNHESDGVVIRINNHRLNIHPTEYLSNWPESIVKKSIIGNWGNRNQAHHLKMQLYKLTIRPEFIPLDDIIRQAQSEAPYLSKDQSEV